MNDVKIMVGQWTADWDKKKKEEEGTERAVSSWMTAAASAGIRDDPMIVCEDGDNSVSKKAMEAEKTPEEEVVGDNTMVPFRGPEGAMEMRTEEDEDQEYQRKKEHLLKRVESEQLADEERINELEGHNRALEQQLKQKKLVG